MILAHIRRDPLVKEPLFGNEQSHLEWTAALAARFAQEMIPQTHPELAAFAREAGRLLGLWHDLGKCSDRFQLKLRNAAEPDAHLLEMQRSDSVDHSTAGAQHAVETMSDRGILLAFAIAGHHAGLPDWNGIGQSTLKARLKKELEPWREQAPADLLQAHATLPKKLPLPPNGFSCAFFVRMLFSCLTDADFLATEGFMSPDKTARRVTDFPPLSTLSRHLEAHLAARFPPDSTSSEVGKRRRQVLDACLLAAGLSPGFFSLNVPTGGGKTLSGLAFALAHASQHGLRRVICAIPFTSIIEQNADVYRRVFSSLGEDIVLEHHANLDTDAPHASSSRLAAENWDAPIVVTTNVQFFESLFANRGSRCRKLHRLARSVIILDEAQALPTALLAPCLRALRELVENYGCTVVLSTATQPALVKREGFEKIGLPNVREIIPDPEALHAALCRVRVGDAGVLTLEETATRLAQTGQGMVIVNSRRHARELYRLLGEIAGREGCFHLSALMCPRHRSERLAEIRQRLLGGEACRVVATQLVEAGVDLDFPVVFRAGAGLDALAQAAGRCNREGRLPGLGQTWLFTPAEKAFLPRGEIGQAAGHAREVISLPCYQENILSLAAIDHYFRLHTWSQGGEREEGWDRRNILDYFQFGSGREPFIFQFDSAADSFQLIEEKQHAVIIPWDERAKEILAPLRAMVHPEPAMLSRDARVLQRYVVNVKPWEYQALQQAMAVETLHERFCVLLNLEGDYSPETGLVIPGANALDPNRLIV